jgi:hypothetical protein
MCMADGGKVGRVFNVGVVTLVGKVRSFEVVDWKVSLTVSRRLIVQEQEQSVFCFVSLFSYP